MSRSSTDAPIQPCGSRRTLLVRIAGGTSLAAVLTVATIALWPASEIDKARADGEQFGAAVAQLQSATSASEVDAALVEVRDAVAETADHAGDEVAEQVNEQADALDRAVDGFVGERSTTDDWEQEFYQWELDVAVDDLSSNAEEFRTQGPEVQQAFWDGYEDGMASA